MKRLLLAVVAALVLSPAVELRAAGFDSVTDYICDGSSEGVWSYEGYRGSDGAYLAMVFDRAPLTEVSKYGVDAHYLPDSGQPYHPYITRMPEGLLGSPATTGPRFDAVVTWTAPEDSQAEFTGSVRLMGTIKGDAAGRKIKAALMRGDDEIWSSGLAGDQTVEFDVKASVAMGDKVRLHIINAGDDSGNMALFDFKVDTKPN